MGFSRDTVDGEPQGMRRLHALRESESDIGARHGRKRGSLIETLIDI